MRARTLLLVVLVLVGCGTVTANSQDAGGAGSSAQGTAGGGGRGSEVGGQGGAELGAGGASGGQAGSVAGAGGAPLATDGPCAGLCADPVSVTLTPHVPLMLVSGSCYAVSSATAGYYATAACEPGDLSVLVNGHLTTCPHVASGVPSTLPLCWAFAPGTSAGGSATLQ